MSPLDQHIPAMPLESERETFFHILLHDDWNSFYAISAIKNGIWTDMAYKASVLPLLTFDPLTNYYVSHHGFNGKRRLANRTRQLNALFFDLDCHRAPETERESLIDAVLERIMDAVQENRMPNPTLIVDSGRGVQLYYVLERSIPYRFRGTGETNKKGIDFYKDVQRRLADVIEEQMEGMPLVDMDRRVFDESRVGRIPGTYNTKAGRNARLVNASEVYYHLPDLASYKPKKALHRVIPGKDKRQKPAFVMKFHPLMMSRLNKIVELQEYRDFDCEGSRELMCFVFYNTAVQIYSPEDAKSRLTLFNDSFKKPLPQSELNGVIRAVSEVVNVKGERGYYVLKADTLARLLALTEKEMLDLQFFASKRMVERMEAKRKTKEKRGKRDEQIIDLYQAGGMTQQEVAKATGCSPRTVHSVLKSAGLTQRHKASQERKNVSLRELAAKALTCETKEVSQANASYVFHVRDFAKNWRTSLEVVQAGDASFLPRSRFHGNPGAAPPPLCNDG